MSPFVTVLVVDDEAPIRRVISHVLVRAGYTVHERESGPAAIEFVRDHAGPIDLLITDCGMCGMSGTEAATRIREMRPDLPILQMSGYPAQDLELANASSAHFIQKPFLGAELRERIQSILGAEQQ